MNKNVGITSSLKCHYIKLFLVSPIYEIISNILYIISFFLLSFQLISKGKHFSNYQLNSLLSSYLNEQSFKSIQTPSQFLSYLDSSLNTLYNIDPNSIPAIIPYGAIRLKKYSNNHKYCTEQINYNKQCSNSLCAIETLNSIYKHKGNKCGYKYKSKLMDKELNSSPKDSLYLNMVKDFEGKYSLYNLVTEGQNIDFSIDEYNTVEMKEKIEMFINDNDMKFIAILINVYFPLSENYGFVIAGIEMVNYFTFPYQIFSSTVFNLYNIKDSTFLVSFIIFTISVALNIIKFFLEVNIQCDIITHSFTFINEFINILLIIFTSIYLDYARLNDNFQNVLNSLRTIQTTYQEHYIIISLHSYTLIIVAILFLFIPFRFISIITWYKKGTKYIVDYFEIIFRILPGFAVMGLFSCLLLFMFTLMNFFLYNGIYFKLENIFLSLLMCLNISLVADLNSVSDLLHSVSYSNFFLLFNVLQIIAIIVLFGTFIATLVVLFQKAINVSSKEKEDSNEKEIILKLHQIKGMLVKEIEEVDKDLTKLKRKIFWLNLKEQNEGGGVSYSDKNKVILCSQSSHVISFLKYLFSLKPEMQYFNLMNKIGIIIECESNRGNINKMELQEIDVLLDWLSFVGCKIPVALYTNEKLERALKMKLVNEYLFIKFIISKEEIQMFVRRNSYENDDNDEYTKVDDSDNENINNEDEHYQKDKVCKRNSFMIYPVITVWKGEKGGNKETKPLLNNSDNENNEDYNEISESND